MAFIYLEDGMDKKCSKNVRSSPLNTKMAKTVTLGSANLLTVTNLGGRLKNCLYLPGRRHG